MANELTIDLSQDVPNALTAIAEMERAKLIPKNDYNAVGNEYSSVNRDAVADGDSMGRGTGTFLDVYNVNAGTNLTHQNLTLTFNEITRISQRFNL
jgi:hypothetical protein